MLRAELKIVGGKHHGKLIPLSRAKFLIGRGDDCQLRPASDLVSRHHCVFKVDDYTARLRDLGSTNGTFVNGERIRGEVLLKTGDKVSIGKLELEMVIHEQARIAQPSGSGGDSPGMAAPDAPATAPPLTAPETEVLSTAETSLEIPAMPSTDGHDETSVLSSDPDEATQEVHSQTTQVFPPDANLQQPGAAPPAPGPAPQPGQYPQYPPGYFGQPGQPGMPYPYPQGQYPGYPQMPGGYPQYPGYPAYYPPPGYPDQYGQYPGYYPQQGGSAPDETTDYGAGDESDEASEVAELPVRLPDPETTGAKAPEPPPEKPQAADGSKPPEVKPSNMAADIIKNFRQRRPGS